MDELQMIGWAVTVVITLGAFLGVVTKFTQPINDLKIVIQKLNDAIENMMKDNELQNKRLARHGEDIDKLDRRVSTIETKMVFYHKEDN